MPFLPMTTDNTRKNYNILADFLKRISYKPGWRIIITEEQNDYAFNVIIHYDSYESENAVSTSLASYNEQSEKLAARLTGKTFRKRERRVFTKRFDMLSFDQMGPENVIRYVIAD